MAEYHLAQLNVAHLLAPIDSPQLADFVARLDEINSLAERSPGFVWRWVSADDPPGTIDPFAGQPVVVNLSVWESVEALHAYAYRSAHADVMSRRREWFARVAEAYVVLYWVPAGHLPTVAEAAERLDDLRRHGPSPRAFGFKSLFAPPAAAAPDGAALPELPSITTLGRSPRSQPA